MISNNYGVEIPNFVVSLFGLCHALFYAVSKCGINDMVFDMVMLYA
jgi:hypothetical protein